MRVTSVALLTALVIGFAPIPAQALESRATLESQLLSRVNQARVNRGIPRLVSRSDLVGVARRWSAHMYRIGDVVLHRNIRSACRNVSRAIHTVAYDVSVREMFGRLMADRDARSALLSRRYNRIGIGVVVEDAGDALYATLIYAKQA